jgi:hypothetical protein
MSSGGALQNAVHIEHDADLASVVEAWDQLPAAIRAGIVAMVQATGR